MINIDHNTLQSLEDRLNQLECKVQSMQARLADEPALTEEEVHSQITAGILDYVVLAACKNIMGVFRHLQHAQEFCENYANFTIHQIRADGSFSGIIS